MLSTDITEMFRDIDEATKEFLVRKRVQALLGVFKGILDPHDSITPEPRLLFEAFRHCPLGNVKVVLLGQDPYIKKSEAMGLSFSVPKGVTIPPSLRNIYKCLSNNGHINKTPTHGDLTNWAKQGVLLLNCALSTVVGKSSAHIKQWSEYTKQLLAELADKSVVAIALGGFAQKATESFMQHTTGGHSHQLTWGHPSPLNVQNQADTPRNFKYCDVFARANIVLTAQGKTPINWDPDFCPGLETGIPAKMVPNGTMKITENPAQNMVENPITKSANFKLFSAEKNEPLISLPCYNTIWNPKPPPGIIWVFTDGGSASNGGSECTASWAFYVCSETYYCADYGIVPPVDINGEKYKSSNNRGELTAIMKALDYLAEKIADGAPKKIILISDSMYSINCADIWAAKWMKSPQLLEGKKNIDIISHIYTTLTNIRAQTTLEFKHVRSHMPEPVGDGWFIWKCNDIVDILCNVALGRSVAKAVISAPKKATAKKVTAGQLGQEKGFYT